jgi:hypothetical protein
MLRRLLAISMDPRVKPAGDELRIWATLSI